MEGPLQSGPFTMLPGWKNLPSRWPKTNALVHADRSIRRKVDFDTVPMALKRQFNPAGATGAAGRDNATDHRRIARRQFHIMRTEKQPSRSRRSLGR